jgi:hypothetical protein
MVVHTVPLAPERGRPRRVAAQVKMVLASVRSEAVGRHRSRPSSGVFVDLAAVQ